MRPAGFHAFVAGENGAKWLLVHDSASVRAVGVKAISVKNLLRHASCNRPLVQKARVYGCSVETIVLV